MNEQAQLGIQPVWREVLCDGETPLGVYAKLRGAGKPTFLLESVVGGERWARYSFIGVGYRARVIGQIEEGLLQIRMEPGEGFSVADEGLPATGVAALRELLARYRAEPAEGLPRFWGGLVGVVGHEFVRDLERLPVPQGRADDELPALEFLLTDTMVIFDNLSQQVRVVATACARDDGGAEAAEREAHRRVDEVVAALRRPAALQPLHIREVGEPEPSHAPEWEGHDHPALVERAKEFVRSGDVFQLVLSQRFSQARGDLDPLDVYRSLRVTNPAPYMYLLELPSATLAGASPEVLVRVDRDERRVTVRPIAGTRPRGATPEADLALEAELLADPKERAEHLMLVDLGRNDVGRIAEAGSVRVEESFAIERYSRVMHIVSEVSGTLSAECDALDALGAAFPAGTLSGAPKVRALELIDELEPASRGWYGGAVGYLGYDGGADFSICIRSVVVTDAAMRVQAGGGLVYDSDPVEEDLECKRKASAVLRAIAIARQGREERGR